MERKKQLFTHLRSSMMFITILPAGKDVKFSPHEMIRFFPVVGLMVGFLLVIGDWAFSLFWQTPVVALLDVLFLAAVTGAFHLDGLGDAADGLFSHRPRERALEIMKDSRTGMMGLVAIFFVIALKMAGLYSIRVASSGFDVVVMLLIVPAYARAGMIFGIKYLKYGRQKSGTGHDLFEKELELMDFLWLGIPVFLSLFLGFKGLLLNGAFVLTIFLILGFYKKKMGCITGDMLGAMVEITEAVLFLLLGAGWM